MGVFIYCSKESSVKVSFNYGKFEFYKKVLMQVATDHESARLCKFLLMTPERGHASSKCCEDIAELFDRFMSNNFLDSRSLVGYYYPYFEDIKKELDFIQFREVVERCVELKCSMRWN